MSIVDEGIKVKDHENLRRDPYSKAIVNVDKNEYMAYVGKRKRTERLEYVEHQVFDLKNDIKDIKDMLQRLVTK